MSFDKPTRNLLAKIVGQCRDRLVRDITEQLQSAHGLHPDGTILDVARTEDDRRATEDLLALWAHFEAAEAGSPQTRKTASYQRLIREIGFTLLNRLAALRLCEERGLVIECVRRGMTSDGFRLYDQIASGALGNRYQTYRFFLEGLFDELALDLGVLFDRTAPQSLIFPSEPALTDMLELLNTPELAAHNLWQQDETIGWIYQYYNDPVERRKMRAASQAPRNSRELAVRNQFFTPRYVVEFLTDNTLGRIWYEMRQGDTYLVEQCRYLVRRPKEIFLGAEEKCPAEANDISGLSREALLQQPVYVPYRLKKDPRDLKLLDPACGSGHFKLYAFDLLITIYEEAWADPNLPPFSKTGTWLVRDYPNLEDLRIAIPGLILRHNLHGIDIDPRAVQIAALALWLRAQRAYQELGLAVMERPRITRTNIVTAEPMPGDNELLEEFVRGLRPRVLGDLVRTVFEKMQIAGEAGSLLRVEKELEDAIAEARRQWISRPGVEQLYLFPEERRSKLEPMQRFDVSGISDGVFWSVAEERVLQALGEYAARLENGKSTRRRLFAEDADQGFAFIDICLQLYDVVLMNPPFGSITARLKSWLRSNYPIVAENVSVAFLHTHEQRLTERGALGAITDLPWLQQASYSDFRDHLIRRQSLEYFVELGWGILGTDVEVCLSILRERSAPPSLFLYLGNNEDQKMALQAASLDACRFIPRRLQEFTHIPNTPFAYQMPSLLFEAFVEKRFLRDSLFEGVGGVAASDANRVYRLWWEVPPASTGTNGIWSLCQNGSPYSPVYYPCYFVIAWDRGTWTTVHSCVNARTPNKEKYGMPGLSFGKRTHEMYSYIMPSGQIFSWEGQALFPHRLGDLWQILALTNSEVYSRLANLVAGQHKYTGYLNTICLDVQDIPDLSSYARAVFDSIATIDRFNETSHEFIGFGDPRLIGGDSLFAEAWMSYIRRLEETAQDALERIDIQINKALGFAPPESPKTPSGGSYFQLLMDFSLEQGSIARLFLSYCIGILFGRWDIRLVLNDHFVPSPADPLSMLPSCPPGMLVNSDGLPSSPSTIVSEEWLKARPSARTLPPEESLEGPATILDDEYPIHIAWDGILVDDPGLNSANSHPNDIVRRVREVLAVLWPHNHDAIEAEACEVLGVREIRDYFRHPTGFFDEHLKRYSKSRRKAPIYWPLSTASGSYTIWLYYHRLDDQILYTAVNRYVTPKIGRVESDVTQLESDLAKAVGRNATELRDKLDAAREFLRELREFREELLYIAELPYRPNLNDGVIINAAPLHKLFSLHTWAQDTEKVWKELEAGKYDWAHMAYTLWPDRVREACKKDRSIAIARGLADLFEEPSSTK